MTKWEDHWGTKLRTTTPYYPMANGMVERWNTSLKKLVDTATTKGGNAKEEVDQLVMAYRKHPTCNYGRKAFKTPVQLRPSNKVVWIPRKANWEASLTRAAKG